MQTRLQFTEASRDQAVSGIALLDRDFDATTTKYSEAVKENSTLSHELTAMTADVKQESAAIAALEAKVANLEGSQGGRGI